MLGISACQLPDEALLRRYNRNGHYTDCYITEVSSPVAHEQFVFAFYTTALFKMERFILKWAVSRPSTDAQAAGLASGQENRFAAWSVEDRCENQLLLSDFQGRTRSWLMVEPVENGTRLYFGSAVVPVKDKASGELRLGILFRLLLEFHKLYSVALLYSAKRRLARLSS